ncbi:MAG: ornithine cyclodeaminase family protein [Steroidobacteraceae bacterium]
MTDTAVAVRVIAAPLLRQLLPIERCVEVVAQAMVATSRRKVQLPLRQGMPLPGSSNVLGMMPGYLGDPRCFGIKLVSLFPGNTARGLSSHLGVYLLYDADTGVPVAMMNAGILTAIRTAAASVVATRALARSDAHNLTIVGTGEQAATHLRAFGHWPGLRRIDIWGRDMRRAAALVRDQAADAGCELRAVGTLEESIRDADIVLTVTSAKEPLLQGRWLSPGTHLCLVGSSVPEAREVDDELVARSRYYVDYRPSTLAQAGEFLHARGAGEIGDDHIVAEIGEVLDGSRPGREHAQEITVYKSLGIAAQDLAAAWHVYREAERLNLGQLAQI